MCPLLVPVLIGFFFFSLLPLTVLMKQTRQVVHAIKQSILLRCLWVNLINLFWHKLTIAFSKLDKSINVTIIFL